MILRRVNVAEMDLPTKYLDQKSLTHGTLAKQGAPSVVGQRKEWSVSITLRYWSIMTGGKEFDHWFLHKMLESYGDRNRNAGRANIEAEVVNATTIVYNEINLQLLIAHEQRGEQQPPACEDDDEDDDDDDEGDNEDDDE